MVRSSGVRIARHHTACRTVDTKPRRGILADDPVSDRSGRRRCLQPLQKGGNAVFFGCGEAVHPDGAVGYRRVPALSALFHTLSQPLPVPKNGTFSLSRAQSRTCSGYAEARKRREKINFSIPRLPTVRILRLGKMQPKFALVLGLFVLWLRRRYSRSAMRK